MSLMEIKVLENARFAPYGTVIPVDNENDNSFDVKLREDSSSGWRIAVLTLTNRTTKQLHCHPDSMEVFELLKGCALLLVAPPVNADAFEAFLLDKPVCVNKGVWHSTIALSGKAVLKITENAMVTKKTHDIGEVKPLLANI